MSRYWKLAVILCVVVIAGFVIFLYNGTTRHIAPSIAIHTAATSVAIYRSKHGDSLPRDPSTLIPHAPGLETTYRWQDANTLILTATNGVETCTETFAVRSGSDERSEQETCQPADHADAAGP